MKILALSNVKGALEPLVDAFSDSHATLMGKEITGDTEEFCSEITEALFKKGYDLVIGATDDYVYANIMLNKNKEVRAAQCSNRDDTDRAKESSPNVILVGSNLSPNTLVNLVNQVFGPSPKPAQQQEKKAKQKETPREATPEKKERRPLFARKEKKEEEEDEEDDEPRGPSRPGIFGKLKDSLGIVEDGQ